MYAAKADVSDSQSPRRHRASSPRCAAPMALRETANAAPADARRVQSLGRTRSWPRQTRSHKPSLEQLARNALPSRSMVFERATERKTARRSSYTCLPLSVVPRRGFCFAATARSPPGRPGRGPRAIDPRARARRDAVGLEVAAVRRWERQGTRPAQGWMKKAGRARAAP
jgi:hypothetical protein